MNKYEKLYFITNNEAVFLWGALLSKPNYPVINAVFTILATCLAAIGLYVLVTEK